MGSKPFRFDGRDFAEVGKVMALAGISAALVAGLQFVSQQDLGAWGPMITAVLTALIKAVQQWSADNSHTEPKS